MRNLIRRIHSNGAIRQFLKLLKRNFDRNISPPGIVLSNRVENISKFISYTNQPNRGPREKFDPSKMKICWIIPDFVAGAGGHMTIFRLANKLESFGHTVTFFIQNPSAHRSGKDAAATINTHFQPFRGKVELLNAELPIIEGDALIATDFFSCYPVRALAGFRQKFYLVQDHETLFHPMGARALLAEDTYTMGFDCLCAGDWLADIMRKQFNGWAMSWPLAFDPNVYFSRRDGTRSERRIAFYSRFFTERIA